MNQRHQQFINEYLICWNATEAYLKVYPKSTREAARSSATDLLAIPSISEEIQRRIDENAMGADEVLVRLAEHARGDMGNFWNVSEAGELSPDLAKSKLRIVKKLKVKTTTHTRNDIDYKTTEVEFELYDAQAALEKLGRHHKLFSEKLEVTGADGGAIQYEDVGFDDTARAARIAAIFNAVRERRDRSPVEIGPDDVATIAGPAE